MFWSKKKGRSQQLEHASAPIDPSDPSSRSGSDRALDVLAGVLRTYGRYAFDVEDREAQEILSLCEQWATRILVGHGKVEPVEGEEKAESSGKSLKRDWPGLLRFVEEQRSEESEYVARSMESFRQAIFCFAGCLGKTVEEERRTDKDVAARLDELSRALKDRDPVRVFETSEEVVISVRRSIDERRRREVQQVWTLGERVRELKRQLTEAQHKAEVDGLTGLMNRAAFNQYIEHLANLGMLLGEPPWLMLLDLDHFKSINDGYGHPMGDEVLRQVSHCLSRTFLRKQDFFSRYGGEEFAVLLIDTNESQAKQLAERLADAVRNTEVQLGEQQVEVTVSIGLAALRDAESAASWLQRADAALYRAKQDGRDCMRFAG